MLKINQNKDHKIEEQSKQIAHLEKLLNEKNNQELDHPIGEGIKNSDQQVLAKRLKATNQSKRNNRKKRDRRRPEGNKKPPPG